MTHYVLIEERPLQEIPLEIANDDKAIVQALVPFYPEASESELKREVDKPQKGDVTISVTPRGQIKGVGVNAQLDEMFSRLKAAPASVNPAVALCFQLQDNELSDPERLIALHPQIHAAIEQGRADINLIERALQALKLSPAAPASGVPLGF